MSNKVLTLREMVLTALQANNQQPVKPSEIASQIKENFPEYCEQKIKSTTQANFDVVKQIAREITASIKLWMKKHPQLKCSEETPRTYWWENGDADVQLAEPANETEKLETKPYAQEEKALYNKLAAYLVGCTPESCIRCVLMKGRHRIPRARMEINICIQIWSPWRTSCRPPSGRTI